MKRNINGVLTVLGLGALILSACTPPPPTPAALPSATVAPTETQLQLPTLPPSWTPGAVATSTPFSGGSSSGDSTDSAPTIPPPTVEGAATLPPTWTPFRVPTVTPQPRAANATFTPVPPTPSPAVSPTRSMDQGPLPVQPSEVYQNPECEKLTIFSEPYIYKQPKTDVQVGWTNVAADYFDLWVRNPEGRYIYREFIPIPEGEQVVYYTIPGSVFTGIGRYTWEVYPVLNEYRMCPTITGTIFTGLRY